MISLHIRRLIFLKAVSWDGVHWKSVSFMSSSRSMAVCCDRFGANGAMYVAIPRNSRNCTASFALRLLGSAAG